MAIIISCQIIWCGNVYYLVFSVKQLIMKIIDHNFLIV